MRGKYLVLFALAMFLAVGCAKPAAKGKLVVENGRDVSITYTLSVDGKVIESSTGRPPLMYRHGKKQIVPGLEKQLTGLHVGDKKKVKVTPEEGYGKVMPDAVKEVKRANLPKNAKPEKGMFVEVTSMDGRRFRAKIVEVKKDTVMMDFNHPLAGKTLDFDIEIVSIN